MATITIPNNPNHETRVRAFLDSLLPKKPDQPADIVENATRIAKFLHALRERESESSDENVLTTQLDAEQRPPLPRDIWEEIPEQYRRFARPHHESRLKLVIDNQKPLVRFSWTTASDITNPKTGKPLRNRHSIEFDTPITDTQHWSDTDCFHFARDFIIKKWPVNEDADPPPDRPPAPNPSTLTKFLRKHARQNAEMFALALKMVGKEKARAISEYSNIRLENARQNSADFMAGMAIEYEDRDGNKTQVTMDEIEKTRKKGKKAQVLCFLDGLDKWAKENDLEPLFLTVTTPPKYHSNPANGKDSWGGYKPTESQKFITDEWALARSRLAKHGVCLAGLRVAESHKDGTAHGHFLIFCPKDTREIVEKEIKKGNFNTKGLEFRWLDDDPENGKKASVATYVSKYIFKTLDSGVKDREKSWRQTHGIRNFQFFGLPSLQTWNAYRADKIEIKNADAEAASDCAKAGDFLGFLRINGGAGIRKKYQKLGSEIYEDKKNKKKWVFGKFCNINVFALFRKIGKLTEKKNDSYSCALDSQEKQSQNQKQGQNQNKTEIPQKSVDPPNIPEFSKKVLKLSSSLDCEFLT